MAQFPHRAGNYILFAELGAGTFGSSYIGRPVGHGGARGIFKPLAIRILDPQLSARGDLIRQLLDEQRAAALLQHPRIAAVQEVGVLPDGSYFLACEYVHGVPLRDVLRANAGKLTPAQSVHIAMQLCDALHYAHERLDLSGKPLRIIHGQLNPDTVLLGFDGNAKIVEFGLLRTRDAATATIPTQLQRRTVFIAPELRAQLPLRSPAAAGIPGIDRRVDVYSIGALLWELLSGESLTLSDENDPLPPSSLRPGEPSLDAIVQKAMARNPADRYATAQALRLQLTGVAAVLSQDMGGSVAMGLARNLMVTFRGRMTAFQEQLDLWRKFEDDALPDAVGDGLRRTQSASNLRRVPTAQGYPAPASATPTSGTYGVAGPATGSLIGALPAGSSGVRSVSGISVIGGPVSSPSGPGSSALRTGAQGPVPDPRWLRGRLFGVLLAVALLALLCGLVLLLRGHPSEPDGTLIIDSQPRGAEIRIDGHLVGRTPHRISDVKAPSVQIEVRKDGYRIWSHPASPEPGKTVSIEADLEPEPDGR